MKKTSKTIIFFGSGPVAAESLRRLSLNFDIEAVITKPRPPHHRGDVPVLSMAAELKLPVKTAASKHDLDELFDGHPFKSEVGVLIDFGIIVSKKVIDHFPLGIVNSHFSLLPEWRGADPIAFAILSGQKQTGVSLMFLVEAMDEGPLIAQGPYDIKPDETTTSLTKYLIDVSNVLLEESLPRYIAREIAPRPQEAVAKMLGKPAIATYSRKLSKDDGLLDWTKPAEQLEREIRAFIDWPKSRARFGEIEVIVTKAHVLQLSGTPGEATIINKLPVIYCKKGALALDRIKPAGKKEMTGEAFLAGYKKQFVS